MTREYGSTKVVGNAASPKFIVSAVDQYEPFR